MIVYLGCYTDDANRNGLKVLNLDEATGVMSVAGEYSVTNALYQALSLDGKYLYSCTGEGVASFSVAGDAQLVAADRIDISDCVCHLSVMPDNRRIVWADYLNGAAGSIEVEEGKFGKLVSHRHFGSGPNLPRQDKAHCHQAVPTPDEKGYCVVDLGLDQIVEYPQARVFHTSPSGAGPRHLLFHPNGRLAFLVYELGNMISSFLWSPVDGFKLIDTHSIFTPSSNLTISTSSCLSAAIRFTPDGKSVVVSNRGENSLVVFDFDEETGSLAFKSRTLLSGNWPRDFIFVNETLALVACERSGEVLSQRYDSSSGLFTQIAALGSLHRPVALTLSSYELK